MLRMLIRNLAPDVAFLDIRMPGATGLEVVRQLCGDPRPRVVFVTAYEQHAVEAFEANAIDYLLKPVTHERLARTVEKLRAAIATQAPPASAEALQMLLSRPTEAANAQRPRHLRWIRASRRSGDNTLTEQIAVTDVLYFQADDKYTCVHARDGDALREWLIRVPLTELAAQLDPERFLQVHRSIIVNLETVAGTRRDLTGKPYVRLRGHDRELPVARQYQPLFRQM